MCCISYTWDTPYVYKMLPSLSIISTSKSSTSFLLQRSLDKTLINLYLQFQKIPEKIILPL